MIITIDGPAGTGKSSVAQAVAKRLKFDFLDTGAMYRAIGLAALRRQVDWNDARELTFVAKHAKIDFDWSMHPPKVLLNGESVGHLLRGSDATQAASKVAVVPAIREMLVQQQREIGQARPDLVSEGRDQGSVVFIDSPYKFYLTATLEERVRRRVAQLRSRGEVVDPRAVEQQITERDNRDTRRQVGPLAVPHDARTIDTTRLSEEQVVDQIVSQVQMDAVR